MNSITHKRNVLDIPSLGPKMSRSQDPNHQSRQSSGSSIFQSSALFFPPKPRPFPRAPTTWIHVGQFFKGTPCSSTSTCTWPSAKAMEPHMTWHGLRIKRLPEFCNVFFGYGKFQDSKLEEKFPVKHTKPCTKVRSEKATSNFIGGSYVYPISKQSHKLES